MAKSSGRSSGGVRSLGGMGGFNPTSQVHGVGAPPPRGGAASKPSFGRNDQSGPKADKGC